MSSRRRLMWLVIATALLVIVATASCMVSRVDPVGDDGDRYAGIGTMATQLATGEMAP